jgi:hypothetical protein
MADAPYTRPPNAADLIAWVKAVYGITPPKPEPEPPGWSDLTNVR